MKTIQLREIQTNLSCIHLYTHTVLLNLDFGLHPADGVHMQVIDCGLVIRLIIKADDEAALRLQKLAAE